jgi:CheY-like chemotaxis protein
MKKLEGRSILVVDDEDLIRELFLEELASAGAQVDFAENGKLAVEKISRTLFDVIVTDYRMPVCDGLAMAKIIQSKIITKPKIIMCTGYAKDLDADEVKKSGISLVIEKPFELRSVVDTIVSLLSK